MAYRDDLAAARTRIDQLERQLAEARTSASSAIEGLEERLKEERALTRALGRRRRERGLVAFALVAVVVGSGVLISWLRWAPKPTVAPATGGDVPASTPSEPADIVAGSVIAKLGAAVYGNANEYSRELYLGRANYGDELELADPVAVRNEHGTLMVKVRILSGSPEFGFDLVGRVGWIGLIATSFTDRFDGATQRIR